MALPAQIAKRLRLPLIAAPMLRVSGPDLVVAACTNGVIGAFPVANSRTLEQLAEWLVQIQSRLEAAHAEDPSRIVAPFCPNLIIRHAQVREALACLVRHQVGHHQCRFAGSRGRAAPRHRLHGLRRRRDVASRRESDRNRS